MITPPENLSRIYCHPEVGDWFKVLNYKKEASCWLEGLEIGKLYKILSVQTEQDFYIDNGESDLYSQGFWIATDCLDMDGVEYEMYMEGE